jgi:3-hydroxybutyryl-CoA dehydratase
MRVKGETANGVTNLNTIGGYDLEDLFVGMSATFTKDLRERDVFFGSACGDKNPLYFDEDFAQRMQFGGHIAPDMLAAAVVSAAIAARLPRPGSVKSRRHWTLKAL